jgi:hypothetical protein
VDQLAGVGTSCSGRVPRLRGPLVPTDLHARPRRRGGCVHDRRGALLVAKMAVPPPSTIGSIIRFSSSLTSASSKRPARVGDTRPPGTTSQEGVVLRRGAGVWYYPPKWSRRALCDAVPYARARRVTPITFARLALNEGDENGRRRQTRRRRSTPACRDDPSGRVEEHAVARVVASEHGT